MKLVSDVARAWEQRQRVRVWQSATVIFAMFVTVAVVVTGSLLWRLGYGTGARAERAAERARAVQVERVMALVVERNPRAEIRAFAGFPDALFAAAAATGVDYRLLLAIVDKESGFHADAVGAAGEVGLMQLLPATAADVARELGVVYTPPTRARRGGYETLGTLGEAAANVTLGAAYLRRQVARYAFLPVSLRAYNRHPDRAREVRPWDRYAEDVALRYLELTHGRLPVVMAGSRQ